MHLASKDPNDQKLLKTFFDTPQNVEDAKECLPLGNKRVLYLGNGHSDEHKTWTCSFPCPTEANGSVGLKRNLQNHEVIFQTT